jgi:RNase P subunit RPR2
MLTLEGLRKLVDMKNKGEKLPEGYEKEVRKYIRLKEKMVKRLEEDYERENEQLKEAISLAGALEVDLKPKKFICPNCKIVLNDTIAAEGENCPACSKAKLEVWNEKSQ